jgi:hypothetical protein
MLHRPDGSFVCDGDFFQQSTLDCGAVKTILRRKLPKASFDQNP